MADQMRYGGASALSRSASCNSDADDNPHVKQFVPEF